MEKIYLVCKEVVYDNGVEYWAVFTNKQDAKKYIQQYKNKDLYIKECKNGDELL